MIEVFNIFYYPSTSIVDVLNDIEATDHDYYTHKII